MTIYKAPFEIDIPDVDLLSFIFGKQPPPGLIFLSMQLPAWS